MPECVICGGYWCVQTHLSPSEDCECGRSMGRNEAKEYEPEELHQMRTEWRAKRDAASEETDACQ